MTYRIDGLDRRPKKPSNREEFIRRKLEKKYSVFDPPRWIAQQSEAEQPGVDTWRKILRTNFQLRLSDEASWVALMREFGERVHYPKDQAHESMFYLIASLLDRSDVEMYARRDGFYLLVPGHGRLIEFRASGVASDKSYRINDVDCQDVESKILMLEATLFSAWEFGGGDLRKRARDMLCKPYAESIADETLLAEEGFKQVTILGSRDFFSCGLVSDESFSHQAERVSIVVIWEKTSSGYAAWAFDPWLFNPDSFKEPRPSKLESSQLSVIERLHGTVGWWPFKRRILEHDLRFCDVYNQGMAVKACCENKPGGPALPFQTILFVRKDRLMEPMPEGGRVIL
ncbi:MAG: hypothetical protein RDU25_02350 [Patescibacteria group bacterium]|nr:hypothetical protein [Patescibacteria group bacterium]